MIDYSKAMLAFSGGKDSVAVSKYMLEQGVKPLHVAIVNREIDYPKHIQFIEDYCKEKGVPLKLVNIDRGVKFLKNNPKYIFPKSSKIKGRWFKIFQQDGIKNFALKNNYSKIIYGRRRADGNSIKAKSYTTKNGLQHFFPLIDWSNKKTLEYIKEEKSSIVYSTENGMRRGTHTINIAQWYGGSIEEALELVKSIDIDMYNLTVKLLKYKNA